MARDKNSYVNSPKTANRSNAALTNAQSTCPAPLLHIIKLLARQAAQEDITAQRSQPPSED